MQHCAEQPAAVMVGLIRIARIMELRASCQETIEAQRRIIDNDGTLVAHEPSLRSLLTQAAALDLELAALGSENLTSTLRHLDRVLKAAVALDRRFGPAVDNDLDINGADSVDFVVELLTASVRPALEALRVREIPAWRPAHDAGYRVQRGRPDSGYKNRNRFWWSRFRDGWHETGALTFDSAEEAWKDAMRAFAQERLEDSA